MSKVVRDTPRQKSSSVKMNLTGTRNSSTLYYDLGRGESAPTINLATFHPRQASPYRPRSAVSSTALDSYISTPFMNSPARGAATTPTVTERAGRHKLQVGVIIFSTYYHVFPICFNNWGHQLRDWFLFCTFVVRRSLYHPDMARSHSEYDTDFKWNSAQYIWALS